VRLAARAGLALAGVLGSAAATPLHAQQAAQQVTQPAPPAAQSGAEQLVQPADAGATAPCARVTFQYDHKGASVPRFLLAIDEEGNARYAAELALPGGVSRDGRVTAPSTQHVEQAVLLTRTTTARIFELAQALDRFNIACESLAKNIADLGKKTLSYMGPGGDGSCVYNFSENKSVMTLTELLQGIVTTLDFGRKLDFDHRFDRLGLDQDTADLMEAVGEGRAIEVGAIGRTLRSIALDNEVLERVRQRASSLLQQSPPPN
jgi:hypothetical protein